MSDENTAVSLASPSPADNAPATTAPEPTKAGSGSPKPEAAESVEPSAPPAAEAASAPSEETTDSRLAETGDAEMKDAPEQRATQPDADMEGAPEENEATEPAGDDADGAEAAQAEDDQQTPPVDKAAAPSGGSKPKSKRKSTGGSDVKAKKLNKKGSRTKLLHLDAKPGDHYFVKLKGFPQWPAVICDEDMLPQALIKTRPVSAARDDGTIREDYAEGGKRVSERTFPVMYLHTNEFGWVPNTDLHDLDPATVLDVKMDKMRKDLQEAYKLASENNSLDVYKAVLQEYQEDLLKQSKESEAQSTPARKSKKAKAAAEEDEDVDMADASESTGKEKKSKKRKAEESVETPQRSGSVKKPRIKLTVNSTPKTTSAATPKSSKAQSQPKSDKAKSKKGAKAEEDEVKTPAAPKEPELSPEEKHARKEKEVLFLRHKLQKGLITRDEKPKAEEMKIMSEYLTKLESFPDIEVSIIRGTKINKVLKAILKLDSIPKEEEYRFKPRSQVLLDQWNKLLAAGGGVPAPAEAASGKAQALNGTEAEAETKTNGSEEKSEADAEQAKAEEPTGEEPTAAAGDDKEKVAEVEDTAKATEVST